MYSNLKKEVENSNYNITNLAAQIGVAEKALNNKMDGNSEFYWSEVVKIREIIAPQLSLEELFLKDKEHK